MAELSGKRCAEVLLEYAKRQGNLEQMYKDAVFVRAVLQKHTDLSRLLSVPTLSRRQRDHILEQLFGGNIDGGLLTVLQTLAGKRLIGEFPLIADHLESAYREYMQEATVQVCSARPLSARQKQSLEKRLSETAGYRSVDVRYKVDKALLGGMVSGTATLKDAVSEAMREWTSRIADTHYCLGSVMGPHPFPTIVRDFQAVISKEIKGQMMEKEHRLPDVVIACVGGGSNAIGSFYHFIGDEQVRLIGCEAAGRGIDTFETAATINTGSLGIFHGMKSYFCQDEYGQIAPVYSISAGLDYPGIGPEHAHLHDIGRAEYVPVTDEEAVCAFEYLAKTEGIIPAIESAHAVAHAMELAPKMQRDQIIVITISGRGDKDCAAIARYRGEDIHE